MNHRWITQTDTADTVITVFGGWGLGWAPFAHLEGDQDVLFVEDYRDLDHTLPDLGGYAQRWLLAYSIGVASFAHWMANHTISFNKTIAACGSLSPVDRRKGIPPAVYQATQDGLTDDSFQSFVALCYGVRQPNSVIDVAARKEELAQICHRGAAPEFAFDQLFIATEDRIWPAANLNRAWGEKATRVDAPHVLFDRWTRWDDLFEGAA